MATATKTNRNAVALLQHAEALLEEYGRPRKRPGKPRSSAERPTYSPGASWEACSPNGFQAEKFSLPGAIKRSTYDRQGIPKTTLYRAKKIAEYAIVEAAVSHGWKCLSLNPTKYIKECGGPLGYLDQECWDTREIVRIVRKAQCILQQKG
jgi:hypothetical protein